MSKIISALVCATSALFLSVAAHAVDGPKLIDQAKVLASGGFPYQITEPGSYRLSSNLVVSGSTDAIDIVTSDVTLDLNGFSISGPGTSAVSGTSTPITGVAVRNGTISGLISGITLSNCTGCSVQQMLVKTTTNGINAGPNALISSNVVTGGSGIGTGIVAGTNSLINGNTVSGSTYGIQGGTNSTVSGNTVSNSYSAGIYVGEYSTVSGNTATSNYYGIVVDCPVNLLGNTALANGSENIFYRTGSGCHSANNLAP
jgi:parallel beta-helix repeat protein